jgi:hypothetical protein
MSEPEPRDKVMVAYWAAEVTELAVFSVALTFRVMWGAATAAFLFGLTLFLRRWVVGRLGGRWW